MNQGNLEHVPKLYIVVYMSFFFLMHYGSFLMKPFPLINKKAKLWGGIPMKLILGAHLLTM